jgi:hypothetical protein
MTSEVMRLGELADGFSHAVRCEPNLCKCVLSQLLPGATCSEISKMTPVSTSLC